MTTTSLLQAHRHPLQFGLGAGMLLLALPLLLSLPWSAPSPAWLPLWLDAADVLAVVLAWLIGVTGYRALLSPRKGAVVWLGVAYFAVGGLALLHLLGRHAGDALPEAAMLWASLASRGLAAIALLVYVLLPAVPQVSEARKQLALAVVALGVALAGALLWQAPALLPPLLDAAGQALPLLQGLEAGVAACSLLALATIVWRRRRLEQECLLALLLAAALMAAACLFFLRAAAGASQAAVALGHACLIAAYLYVFHVTLHEALRRPLERLQTLYQRENATLTAAPDGVLWVDAAGTIVLANPAMRALSGYEPQELLGQNVAIFLPPHLRAKHAESMRAFFHERRSRPMGVMDLKLYRKDGGTQAVDISLGYWEVDGQPHAIAYLRDLSERKQLEESLRHRATHDELTGLPNRWLLQLQLTQALPRAQRHGQRVAVLFLDLDHFKSINDTFGHAVGDALLVEASRRLQTVLRASDLLARMGGDEFAVLLPELDQPEEAVTVALKMLACLQDSFQVQGHDLYSGGSIGLAYYPDDARDAETLLRYADMAMYQAKQGGRGSYACYSQELDRRSHDDLQLHARLKAALRDGLLQLHYQPQVALRDGRLLGAEALLRWHDPVLGSIGPDRFIPLAEATGLILPLADWVLEAACRQIAAWQRAGTPLRVAVNVSAHQLHQGQLAEKVRAALQRSGASAQLLELEITETVAMTQPRQAVEQLRALAALGCSIALDDFGTGYSSLAYLKSLPVSKIKIDASFVQDITEDPNDDIIVQTLIGMARNLGLELIAEGVETEAQRERLLHYGCSCAQGYLFHRPQPAAELQRLLLQDELAPDRQHPPPGSGG